MEMKATTICKTIPFENGAGPMWCYGNSTIVRVGDNIFATNMRVLPERKRHNRTSLEVYAKRGGGEWTLEYYDEGVYQREPCPVMYLGGTLIGVTVNPITIEIPADQEYMLAPCQPRIYIFDTADKLRLVRTVVPEWDDPTYEFVDHSYRSHAVDKVRGDIFLADQYYLGNGEGAHCWTLLDKDFKTIRFGKLDFAERSCYHNICIRDGETYVFAVQDIHEPNKEWADYKLKMTGNEWDYDFRTIFLNYSSDIRNTDFAPSLVITEREATCGHVSNLDCTFTPNGDVLFLCASKRIWHDFMRDKFFPDTKFDNVLELVRLRKGKIIGRSILDVSNEFDGKNPTTGYAGGFHITPDGKEYLFFAKSNTVPQDDLGDGIYLCEVNGTTVDTPKKIYSGNTAYSIFTSRTRLGSETSNIIDFYWSDEKSIFNTEYHL